MVKNGWAGRGNADMTSHDVRSDQVPRGAGTGSEDVPVLLAASTIVLRGDPLRVLLMRRNDNSTFVPGAWVFPGGMLDASDSIVAHSMGRDGDELGAFKVCAARELFEETGIWTGAPLADPSFCRTELLEARRPFSELAREALPGIDGLVLTSRWVTPVGVPKRYDTCFFLIHVADDSVATPDLMEGVEMIWITPSDALERQQLGELSMVFPTIRNLEAIATSTSAEELLESRRQATIPTTRPILVQEGDRKRIVLPGES